MAISPSRSKNIMTEFLYKVIVVGEANVGKTSIIKRYIDGTFSSKYKYTIGVDFALKVLELEKDTIVRLQLWDIAGQERFGVMTHVYYKESAAAVIVFDVTSPRTLDAVIKWKKDVDSKVHAANGNPVPSLLLANKCDINNWSVTREEISKFAEENGFIGWYETSAKENKGLDKAYSFLVHDLLSQSLTELKNANPTNSPNSFSISDYRELQQPSTETNGQPCSC